MRITVSSRGLLVQKLDTNDLQSERTAFDGTMVYAQNKVRVTWVLCQGGLIRGYAVIGISVIHSGTCMVPSRETVLFSQLCSGGVGDPQSQQRFLTLHCSEGTRTWEAILLPLGSPHSLARQMPLEKQSFQAPFEGHVP